MQFHEPTLGGAVSIARRTAYGFTGTTRYFVVTLWRNEVLGMRLRVSRLADSICAACMLSGLVLTGRAQTAAPVPAQVAPPPNLQGQTNRSVAEAFKPYPHPFPQIIQASDYASIVSIESLFADVSRISVATDPVFGFACTFAVSDDTVTFSSSSAQEHVVIQLHDSGVVVNGTAPTNPATVTLYRTLFNVLARMTVPSRQGQVRLAQWGATSYKTLTRFEFTVGSQIVELASDSNGPANPERLYVLDLIDRQDSLLFRSAPAR